MPLLDRMGRGLETVSAYVVDLLTPGHLRTRARLSDEELETLIEIGEEEGALYEGEAEMIQEGAQARIVVLTETWVRAERIRHLCQRHAEMLL